MKASRAAARQLKTVETIEDRLSHVEEKLDLILSHLGLIEEAPEDPALSIPDSTQMVEEVQSSRKRKAG
jgi:hypothetical protein